MKDQVRIENLVTLYIYEEVRWYNTRGKPYSVH